MADLVVTWGPPIAVVLSLCAIMVTLANCTGDPAGPRSLDLSVKGSYTPGSRVETWNQNPQGGPDEKSNSAPIESAK